MILRLGSLVAILYALGFFLFSITLAEPADADARTDGIVAITGGEGRIEQGVAMLGDGRGKRMLIAGADPSVTKGDLVRRLGGKRQLVQCCVDLGSESVDTRSNAEEARRWIRKRGYRSIRLITSDWHMRRAEYEFRRQLGKDVTVLPDAVRSEPRFVTLFGEYNKYILRRLAVWLDI
ncbi:YdcF family protein [Sphingomonas sp. HDW15A]|uniref:YdcF family protein n=1 Tax=Sphingomonas sp. HDW15A TaxID=2714942 RepID=UPI0014095494|nr:YdcF family protein [Sphingomonas sp. HDW15A]QIK96988.1 YdcF family protein [Sphingomonas sp. HDW15A]